MKKTIYFLAAAVMTLVASCAKDNLEPTDGPTGPERKARIEVSSDNGLFVPSVDGTAADLNFKTKGGEVVVAVSTNLDEWNYSLSDESWLSVSADKHYLTISAPLNESDAVRTVELTLTAYDSNDVTASYVINVSQNWAGQPEITPSTNSVHFPAFGELASEVKIETNQEDLKFECTSQWLLVEKVEGGLKLSAHQNTATSERTVDLKLTAGVGKDAATDIIRISQDGKAYIELSTNIAHCDGKGGVNEISFTSNPELGVKVSPVEGDDWYSVTESEGKITININPSSDNKQRKGEVEVLVGDLDNTALGKIKVIQIGEDTEELMVEYRINNDNTILTECGVAPTKAIKTVDVTVDWGDGSEPEHIDGSVAPSHMYKKAGKYLVVVKGTAPAYDLSDNSFYSIETATWSVNILNIISWGKLGVVEAKSMCKSSEFLENIPGDTCGSFENVTDFTESFSNCKRLKEIPEDLFKYATKATKFQSTFESTAAIKAIPEKLFANCPNVTAFDYTFSGCGVGNVKLGAKVEDGNVIDVPEGLFAACPNVTKFTQCFAYTKIATLPENLFAKNTKVTSFNGLFAYCSEMETVPAGLFANNPDVNDFAWLFYGSHVKKLPAGLFKSNAASSVQIRQMFMAATIEDIPDGFFEGLNGVKYIDQLFANAVFNTPLHAGILKGLVNATAAASMFYGTNITEIPAGLFEGFGEKSTSIDMSKAFFRCEGLTTIPADVFDAVATKITTLNACFQNCVNLRTVADGFANACTNVKNIGNLFYGCTSLESLPATMLTGSAAKLYTCTNVFWGCTALKSVPDNLFGFITAANATFGSCFNDCTSLTTVGANVFPATTAMSGLNYVFQGCTALTDISPDVFAKCTKVTTVNGIFKGCTALKTVPGGLFAKMTGVKTFDSVFINCAGLESVPENLFASNTVVTKFQKLFYNCTALKSVPAGLFAKCSKVTDFNNLFWGCSSLSEIPSGLFDGCPVVTNFTNLFWNCTSLKNIPAGLFAKCTKAVTFVDTFAGCTGIDTIPEGLFDSVPNTASVSFKECFINCTSLKSVPVGLFDKAKKARYFSYTFANCTSLTGESPYTEHSGVKVHLYERKTYDTSIYNSSIQGTGCFTNCTGLSDYDAIPTGKNGWK